MSVSAAARTTVAAEVKSATSNLVLQETKATAEGNFDLSLVPEFAAIICSFEGESSQQKDCQGNTPGTLLHNAGQHEDMFAAYLYIKSTILPVIKQNGISTVSTDQLIMWINQLHLRMAQTLAADENASLIDAHKSMLIKAGEFVNQPILRWQQPELNSFLSRILYILESGNLGQAAIKIEALLGIDKQAKAKKKKKKEKAAIKSEAGSEAKSDGIKSQDIKELLNILLEIKNDRTIKVPEELNPYLQECTPSDSQKILLLIKKMMILEGYSISKATQNYYLDPSNFMQPVKNPVDSVLYKLFAEFHRGNFSDKQKAVIYKFIRFGAMPSEIPARMTAFCQELITRWAKCDGNNADAVAELCYFAFYNQTEIHPHFNCNGRTGTALVNVILSSLGWPSIMMRYPNERDDANSSYSQAIANIYTNPKLLTQHIKMRMLAAKEKPYENPQAIATVVKRVTIAKLIRAIKSKLPGQPGLNLNVRFAEALYIGEQICSMKKKIYKDLSDEEMISIVLDHMESTMAKLLDQINTQEAAAQQKAMAAKSTTMQYLHTSSIAQRVYTDDEVTKIIEKLATLTNTNQSDWVRKSTNGLTLFLKVENTIETQQWVAALGKTEALKVNLIGDKLLRLDGIKTEELMTVKSLKTLTATHAPTATP